MSPEVKNREALLRSSPERKAVLAERNASWYASPAGQRYSFEKQIRTYGLTSLDYALLYLAQDGICAICRAALDLGGEECHTVVDHCHATGEVRGLLCRPCNNGLGAFRDSSEALARAVAYLKGRC